MKTCIIGPCEVHVPEAVQQAANVARDRANAVLDRLEVKLDTDGKTAELREMIDASHEIEKQQRFDR